MAQNKTIENKASVKDFIAGVQNPARREAAEAVLKLMKKVTGKPGKMWGDAIVGFDKYHYKYDSGREGDMCMIGFSPRSTALSVYVRQDFKEFPALLKKLGKHKMSGNCLHLGKIGDVDLEVLEEILRRGYQRSLEAHRAPAVTQ